MKFSDLSYPTSFYVINHFLCKLHLHVNKLMQAIRCNKVNAVTEDNISWRGER